MTKKRKNFEIGDFKKIVLECVSALFYLMPPRHCARWVLRFS